MRTLHRIAIPAVILMLSQILHCGTALMREPLHRFESYSFDQQSSLVSRVTGPPPFALDYLRKLDGRPDYQPYIPDRSEMMRIKADLASLPPLHRAVLQSRLVGIYFIKDFMGSGLTDWIVDSQKNVYTVMFFNASLLNKNISELLTEKEKTCYRPGAGSDDIRIDCGKKYSGFTYTLIHESTHAVDYVKRITPYVDMQIKRIMGLRGSTNDFTGSVWKGYDTYRGLYLFTKRLFFYGFSSPQLDPSEANDVYRDLSRSPFVSLYGSLSWAEDLAEMVTFYHLTRIMKQPYTIIVEKNGKSVDTFRPMEFPEVCKRLHTIEIFYRPGGI